MISATTEVTPAPMSTTPTPTAPPPRTCEKCRAKTLSYNNSSGMCVDCQKHHGRPRSRSNGHNGAQPHRELQVERKSAKSPKLNGADHDHSNGKVKAAPAEDPRLLLVMPRGVESRVDVLIAAIPHPDKVKLLSAWLEGTF